MDIRRAMRASALLIFACAGTGAALGQSMDYGSLEQLFGEPVTTSVTGAPQRASEVPATMVIVTAEEIRRSGAHDIAGVLRHVTGVDVMQWANHDTDVGVRGYNRAFSPGLLVLIDGRQVYADHDGYTAWSTLPVELGAIRQIEVVKGPNAALFGFNAVYGVINIVTFNPLYDDIDSVSVSGGTQSLVQGSAVTAFKLGERVGLRLSGGTRSDDNFSTPLPSVLPGQTTTPQPVDRLAFGIAGFVVLNDRSQLTLEASHSEAHQDDLNPVYTLTRERFRTQSIRAQYVADTTFGIVQASAYTNWNDQLSQPGLLDFENRVTIFQLQDVFQIGTDHTLRVSAEQRHNEVHTTSTTGGTVFYDVLSGAAMWAWKIRPALTLTNAARLDDLRLGRDGTAPPNYPFDNADWDRTIREFSFNSGLTWTPGDADTLRLTVARGFQLPNLSGLGGLLIVSPFLRYSGVPTLEPTRVTNLEIGWDHAFAPLDAQFRASVFHLTISDVLSVSGGITITPQAFYVGPSNLGDSKAYGLELELKHNTAEHWRWGVNYRYERVTDEFDPFAQGGIAFMDYEHVTPRHLANLNAGWAAGPWELDGFLHYQSATRGLQPNGSPSLSMLVPVNAYVSLDARVAFKIGQSTTLSLTGQNLLNGTQQQTSAAEVERRAYATVTFEF
jgi:outer membrane receptor for ferrienterochelin and colicins